MADERWWKGPGVAALTSIEPKSYWFVHARENQSSLLDPEMNYPPGW
jgi:hypothetical protein